MPLVSKINGLEEEISKLTDSELRNKTEEFKNRLQIKMYSILKNEKPPVDCIAYLNWGLVTSRFDRLPDRVQCASTAYNLEIWALRLQKLYPELSGISVFYYAL